MSNTEANRLIDFMARELIDLVKQECKDSLTNPDDPDELLGVVREWLNGQNLKRRLYAAAKLHLKRPA